MNVGFFVPVVVAAALASSCDDEGGLFDSLRSESSVYYYNQITSQGGALSDLTVDFTVEGDESDSVNDVGYSGADDAPELNVRIDDANDNEDNSVQIRGVNPGSGSLFSDRARLSNDTSYTAVSYGDLTTGSVDVGLFQQDQSDVETGTARFRVINTVVRTSSTRFPSTCAITIQMTVNILSKIWGWATQPTTSPPTLAA